MSPSERTMAHRDPDESIRADATRRARLPNLSAHGEPYRWLLGGGLVLCLAMIVGLLGLVLYQGLSTFWPGPVVRVELVDGTVLMGEVTRDDRYRPTDAVLEEMGDRAASIRSALDEGDTLAHRRLFRTGNFDLTGTHFHWVSDYEIAEESRPAWALVIERMTWGRFYGFPAAMEIDGEAVATEPAEVWRAFNAVHGEVRDRFERRRSIEKHEIGRINRQLEAARLRLRGAERRHEPGSAALRSAIERFEARRAELDDRFAELRDEIEVLNVENARYAMRLTTAQGEETTIALADIVRAYPANRLDLASRLGVYGSRWVEFFVADPREANAEGGVYPAIFGTVVMTLLMTFAVVPFGVLAALYLREYAKEGVIVSFVKIAVNNLAGVPSIVFGVFGLGFFCYVVGGGIDQVFFQDRLPSPTYGTGGILWASLTLALLTLPVVIVATEEALAAVPNSMREGSYGCGATKWQTIRRIVLPRAMPGIMTGMILAMARGAGEVAPLMLVGAVKLAPELPVDSVAPFIHPERSFMHLGFHIFDLGFQSQNSEAAKPMVYTTTLLLIAIIAVLNLSGVALRARLRKKFHVSQF